MSLKSIESSFSKQASTQEKPWDGRFLAEAQEFQRRLREAPIDPTAGWGQTRIWLSKAVESRLVESALGFVILLNVIFMIIEVDYDATCTDTSGCVPEYVPSVNNALLGIYTLDLAVKIYVYRLKFWTSRWNMLDALIVASGYSEFAVAALMDGSGVELGLVRVLRIARVMRATKLFKPIPELFKLIVGFVKTMKAIFWGFIMIMIIVVIFSLLAVQITSPMREEVFPDPSDEWCRQAFSSIAKGALFFFQTLVAGDSWGQCSVPLIMHQPLLYVLFAGAFIVIQLGFTNLVLSVIVEAAAEQHSANIEEVQKSEREKQAEALYFFHCALEEMDKDGSNTVSYAELMEFYFDNPEVQQRLEEVGLDKYKLTKLYQLLDGAHDDEVKYADFLKVLGQAQDEEDSKLRNLFTSLEMRKVVNGIDTLLNAHPPHQDGDRHPKASPVSTKKCDSDAFETSMAQLRSLLREDRLVAESQQLDQEMRSIEHLEVQLRKQLDDVAHHATLQAARLSRLAQVLESPEAMCTEALLETTERNRDDLQFRTDDVGLDSEKASKASQPEPGTSNVCAAISLNNVRLEEGAHGSHQVAHGGSQLARPGASRLKL
eukprot:TRINITY_DN25906_c0_g1_i2.p1 TRINITY_DN25906_c0_g1~~TRINITY_DN25906_c0_g1_i2.p1  ORF type:complete len:653 (-),score=119.55 TRINITY_DN25906_c0_g1_i2:56-1861(-)